jgi:PhnB protein
MLKLSGSPCQCLLHKILLPGHFKSIFKKLSGKGTITCPISDKMLAGEWASLTDRYGVQWIFAGKTPH